MVNYKSKIDICHILLWLLGCVALLAPLFVLDTGVIFYVYLVFAIAFIVLLTTMIYFSSYKLTRTGLYIRCGFISLEIDYKTIVNIKKSKNFSLSFATSLNKIELSFGSNPKGKHNKVYISPVNADRFIAELSDRCPNIDNSFSSKKYRY